MGIAAAIGRSVNIPIIVRSLGHELYQCQLTLNNGFKPGPDLLVYLDGNLSGNGRDDPHLLVEDFHVGAGHWLLRNTPVTSALRQSGQV